MNTPSYIIVEQGTPYEKGAFIALHHPKLIIGRKSKNTAPDISFDNIHVSREHLEIHCNDQGQYFVKDLGSKHGTLLNNKPLSHEKEILLKHSDKLVLADGCIKLSFSTSSLELTADLEPIFLETDTYDEFTLDSLKQELTVSGNIYSFSEKEYKGIELLLQQRGHFVSVEEIKKSVWPERLHSNEEFPDVSMEEVNALIYRIRKKTQDLIHIENIRGKGYVLSFK
ncbi:FHA domain-containing protein [Bacillus sp. AK031]